MALTPDSPVQGNSTDLKRLGSTEAMGEPPWLLAGSVPSNLGLCTYLCIIQRPWLTAWNLKPPGSSFRVAHFRVFPIPSTSSSKSCWFGGKLRPKRLRGPAKIPFRTPVLRFGFFPAESYGVDRPLRLCGLGCSLQDGVKGEFFPGFRGWGYCGRTT